MYIHNCVFYMSTSFNNTIWAPFSAIAIGTILGSAAVWGVETLIVRHYKQIDRLTTEQCITHAWQGGDPEIMTTWCNANGYPTEPRRYVTTNALKAF
tara:strand:- start:247 stop:537 length:291 start_codon:yes stop_codon:yes gene_type:complete